MTRRRRIASTVLVRLLAAAVVVTFAAAGPLAAAESGGGEKKKDNGPRRDQAGTMQGDFILLDPLFIPVLDEARGRTAYMGVVVRLQPNPERRLDACYTVPDLVDELVIDFFEKPVTREEQTAKGNGPIRKRVEAVVKRVAGPQVMSGVSVFDQMPELDETSAKLSRACK